MTDALFNTQQALFDALGADGSVQAFIGNPARIYDHAPPGLIFPYVTFGDLSIAPYDTKTETGFEQIVTLDIWSRYRGSREAKDIFAAIYAVLHRAPLSVSGEVFLLSEFHSAEVTLLDDGLTTHASARFSLITQST